MHRISIILLCLCSLVGTAQEIGSSRIRPRDVLRISVRHEPGLSRTVDVGVDGSIMMPLLNQVNVAGYTPKQVAELLKQRFQPFVSDPEVTVSIEDKSPLLFPSAG